MYQQTISEVAARIGHLGINARHVEAWMRLEYGTLDHLRPEDFAREIRAFATSGMTTADADDLAESFAL